MAPDPKRLVAVGYDAIAEAYLARYAVSAVRDAWLAALVSALPQNGRVLDIGCGASVPVARRLVELGHSVVGVDGSARQIELARGNVAGATFLDADMTAVEFTSASFDGVAAFHSLTHLPAAEHGELLRRVAAWLKPGGVFVASFGAGAAGDWQGEWLGAEMFFSQNDEATSLSLIERTGLRLGRAEVIDQDNEDARFLWVLARKPSRGETP